MISSAALAHNGKIIAAVPKSRKMIDFLADMVEKSAKQDFLTVIDNGTMIHCLRSGDVMVFCETKEKSKHRTCNAFLLSVDEHFKKIEKPTPSKITTLLKDRLKYYNDPRNDKIISTQKKVDELKDVMIDNIEKILERGQKLSDLQQSVQDLDDTSNLFRKDTRKMKWWYWFLYIVTGAWIFGN
jgi:hypothetical protein